MNETDKLLFPYHYGQEAEQYSFYRVPKLLFTEPVFRNVSTDAKLLYGLLLDRMQLSMKNHWLDEDGRVYIYFTIDSVMTALGCGNKKAGQLLAELDDRRGIGLITRKKQGQGKPDQIFVHKCSIPEVLKAHVQKCQNDMSGSVESTCLDVSKGHPNKTDKNDTEINENKSIYLSEQMWINDGIENYKYYRELFLEQLYFDSLLVDYPYEEETLYEILELLVETVCTTRKMIRIAGEEKPSEIVKSRLLKLNGEHIRYVLMCMKENTTHIRNIRQYLLAALYNAPATMSSYYSARVNHDMYGRGG
ncbi:MAG: replication initiator protein A [Clostridia bacterium]|nr:replication initiator protein A [Clostridia bacterium]